MALKLRKDIKKSSYYVWFLGAKESKGLRGNEFILPVIKHLEERERDIEPFKVTLQVSHKGLKIIQNVTTPLQQQQQQQQQTAPSTMTVQQKTKTKNEIIKHFIPHNTITCCYQQDDIIACILLLFNPVTKCPLHIHAYRCDSIETATLLKQQLQTLIDRPDNQKKFAEIESRLKMATMHQQPTLQQQPPPMMMKKFELSLCSDRSTRESESSEERYTNETNRNVATLYDSVAAELREKLSKNNVPILLPPRDYDTVHRQKGNLTGIELRRCLNSNIVGQNVLNNNNNNNNNNNSNNKGSKRLESSGGSSGIGSDHPPSPDTPESPDTRYNAMDNHSTSDEDWNGDPAESTLYLIQNTTTTQMTLPRPGQTTTSRDRQSPDRRSYQQNHRYHYQNNNNHHHHQNDNNLRIKSQQYQRELTRYLEQPISKFGGDKKLFDRQKSLERHHHHHQRYYNDNNDDDDDIVDDRINGVDDVYGDNIDGGDDVNDDDDDGGVINDCRHDYKDKNRKFDDDKPRKYFDDDGFDENLRYRSKSTDFAPRYHYDNPNDYYDNENKPPIPRQRQKYQQQQEKFDKPYQYRQRSASPPSLSHNHHHHQLPPPLLSDNDNTTSPRDRFKDAKEKFLQMEQQRYQHHPHHQHHHHATQYEPPISPMITKDKKPFLKRHESLAAYEKNQRPKPAPRNLNNHPHPHQPLQQNDDVNYRYNTNNGDNYQKYDKYEPKRRSMFSLIEEEHRKNSSEIAKELKRRSYLDNENYSKSSIDLDHIGGGGGGGGSHGVGYRHSYVEPTKTRNVGGGGSGGGGGGGKNKNFGDVLHRTNSISNNGRVGIASIHPY